MIPEKYRHFEKKLDYDNIYSKQETIFEWNISELSFDEINTIMNFFQNSFYKIDLISTQKISLDRLSFGEKQLIFILNQIYKLAIDTNKDSIVILFLDEIDIGFHPDWQKRTIKYIIDFLSLIPNKNFHLIFTTHSPFLLSDIPKENIIFLDTYKKEDKEVKNQEQVKGNCKVSSHDEVLSKNQTFGANIHTLLSDSFFMKDGLMGEFAKNKIQEIMDYLNNIKTIEEISTKEEQIKQVIESIGEPFLKRKLLDMYYTKYKDESLKEARKKELEAQQRQIEEELKRL